MLTSKSDHEPGEYIDEEMALDEMETDGVDWVFRPTDPTQLGVRNRYRRLRLEMQILASKAHEDLGDIHRTRSWKIKHVRAEGYMRNLLDAEHRIYSSMTNALSIDENTAEEPCYQKLGVTSDSLDAIVADFYTLQVKHDDPNSSFYLSALEAIAKKRRSDLLSTLFQTQKSLGAFTRQDLSEAYSTLIAEPVDDGSGALYTEEDDETLINIAASMMLDDVPHKARIRAALAIIGKDRDSQEIRKFLNNPQRDFDLDAALRYLGAEDTTDDDFLITLFDIKQEDNSQLARSALETIADERKNVRLKRFLDTGDRSAMPSVSFNVPDQSDIEMLDPDLAYSKLGVDDRTTDDDMLIMLYEIRVADDPAESDSLRRALELLGDVRKSQTIKSFIATGSKEVVTYSLPEASNDRPVGLENIGNTCYLNSLLQYYFTIQPLRHAILQPDGLIELEISGDVLTRKKVGGRTVTKEEVERALRFMKELKRLFRSLVSCKAASLKPSRAVCFLALVSQKDESVHTPQQQQSGENSTQMVKGSGLSLQTTELNQLVRFDSTTKEQAFCEPDSDMPKVVSDVLSDSVSRSPKRKVEADWELLEAPSRQIDAGSSPNLMDFEYEAAKSPGTVSGELSPDADPNPLVGVQNVDSSTDAEETPPKRVRTESVTSNSTAIAPINGLGGESSKTGGSPTASWDPVLVDVPALPARSADRRRQSSLLWSEMNDWGRQQDVAECIDNVLFQMEAALLATKLDEDGEQIDLVKELFYGATKQTLELKDSEPKLERFSNTIVTLERDSQDLYEALDGVFDVTEVELGGKQIKLNLTIAQAPPILQIQIQRVNFDLKSMSAVKSNLYLALDQSIYLDRYMETQDPDMLKKREDYWSWKKTLLSEKARKDEIQNLIANAQIVGPQYSDHNWSATENEVDSDDEVEVLHLEHAPPVHEEVLRRGSVWEIGTGYHESSTAATGANDTRSLQDLEQELRSCEAKERDLSWKIRYLFDDDNSHEYRLHSVFIHRGEASHGHYWVYIYDYVRDRWMKYNDEEVSVVSKEEVFQDRTGSNENPYMLSYVRADKLDLTSSLERDMEKDWEDESLI